MTSKPPRGSSSSANEAVPTPLIGVGGGEFYDLCIGLGQHCESTFQIRRITGQESAHFFDWLEIDLEFVRVAIETDFRDVLRPGKISLTTDGGGALDFGAGIEFYHEFTAEADGDLTLADIESQLPAVREKYAFLATRWQEMASSSARVLYIRQDANGVESVSDICQLQDTIATRYPGHDFALLWLRRSVPDDLDALPPGIAFREVALAPGRWQGDDEAWDGLFNSLPAETLWPHHRTPDSGCPG
ncbi:DUF1796 family putative cysteine peptidase [Streptomyces sp. NPDC088725]|uniref:DUF1796 family putative cysteine peptidase n=1 Tax=Streptomyces sp. NPDC088725 TaxID=3365873 RepID=UPI003807CAFD